MAPGGPRISRKEALEVLREALSDSGHVDYSAHASQRLNERDVTTIDLINVLSTGTCVRGPDYDPIHGNFKITMRTKRMEAIVAVTPPDHASVVTVWRVGRR